MDPRRLWLLSGSRGTEAELLVADHWPALVHGVVAEAPSAFAYGPVAGQRPTDPERPPSAWTLHGRPLPAATANGADALRHPDGSISDVPAFTTGLALPGTQQARIPLAAVRGPVLLIAGADDQLWPSGLYAKLIMPALRRDPAVHERLEYPDAGHLVFGLPYTPQSTEERRGQLVLDLGGTDAGDEAAHERDWPAALAFIAGH